MINKKIALIGLGYVGLPLAVEFGKKSTVVGFDINQPRINDLKNGVDSTLETTYEELKDAVHLSYTINLDDVKDCEIFIITVPTPIDKHKRPDLTPLEKSSEAVGSILKEAEPGDLVKYGLIPEFIGRLPVVATLEELDEAALIQILVEPKNALVKQYQALFEMEDVELEFRDSALSAVAQKAMERKTGARGLRTNYQKIGCETPNYLERLRGRPVGSVA